MSEQAARSEARRRLGEGKQAMKLGEYERAIFAFKKGIEAQQRQSEVNLGRMQVTTAIKSLIDLI
eukprot:COSAG04_NODE_4228_length_2222_cov_1.087612_3_plen_65_part_00